MSESGPVRSLRFSALIASTSSADNPKSKMSMFSRIRSGVTDLGKTDSGVSDIDPARCRPVYTAVLPNGRDLDIVISL